MLISTSKNFLFLHLYKSAGTSIRATLLPYCSMRQIVLQNLSNAFLRLQIPIEFAPIHYFHPKLVDVKAYMGVSFDDYYKFAFAREPLSLQASLYHYMRKNPRHHQHRLVSKFTFTDYIRWRLDHEVRLASDFVCDANGISLLDEVYHFEELKDEFARMCRRLDITADLPLKNVSGLGKTVTLSDTLQDEFKQRYAKDYEFFGYK